MKAVNTIFRVNMYRYGVTLKQKNINSTLKILNTCLARYIGKCKYQHKLRGMLNCGQRILPKIYQPHKNSRRKKDYTTQVPYCSSVQAHPRVQLILYSMAGVKECVRSGTSSFTALACSLHELQMARSNTKTSHQFHLDSHDLVQGRPNLHPRVMSACVNSSMKVGITKP